MAEAGQTQDTQDTGVATALRLFCKHCGGKIDKPRKGKEYCSATCRYKQWDKDHPRVVPWRKA